MEHVKGKISNSEEFTVKTRKGTPEEKDADKFRVSLEGSDIKYQGWGKLPAGWKDGAEVEFDFEKSVKGDYVNYDIRLPKQGGRPGGGFDGVIRALVMPKVQLFYDRTEQPREYCPVKMGGTVSFSAEDYDPKKAEAMMESLAASIDKKLEEKVAALKGRK